jgi:hypothetical protein
MDDFRRESTDDETIFVALSQAALKWGNGLKSPFRDFFDTKGGAFIFPLPVKQKEAEDFKSRIQEAGFRIRET